MTRCDIGELQGKTFTSVVFNGSDEITFNGPNGSYKMFHFQNCCEDVRVEDIAGELSDLENTPILMAEETASEGESVDDLMSSTWTFYKFATQKGYVTIRWYGESNGYYSEEVDIAKLDEDAT